jgi:hypothetical protein
MRILTGSQAALSQTDGAWRANEKSSVPRLTIPSFHGWRVYGSGYAVRSAAQVTEGSRHCIGFQGTGEAKELCWCHSRARRVGHGKSLASPHCSNFTAQRRFVRDGSGRCGLSNGRSIVAAAYRDPVVLPRCIHGSQADHRKDWKKMISRERTNGLHKRSCVRMEPSRRQRSHRFIAEGHGDRRHGSTFTSKDDSYALTRDGCETCSRSKHISAACSQFVTS